MTFGDKVKVTPTGPEYIEKLFPYMVLLYTGIKRKSPKIQEGLKVLTPQKIEALKYIKELAKTAQEAIPQVKVNLIGEMLSSSWEFKKKSNDVTTPEIDEMFEKAKRLGSYGGKLLGSGGGGHLLFLVNPADKAKFIKKMGLEWVDFSIDCNGLETRIL
jgi:D-glycero-alpha-D-manno-heptose-7-phosphate kinase